MVKQGAWRWLAIGWLAAILLAGCAADPAVVDAPRAAEPTPTATPGPPMPRIISAGDPQCFFEVEVWGDYTLPLAEYCPHLLGRTDLEVACEKDNRLTDQNVSGVEVAADGRAVRFVVQQYGTCTILPDAEDGERFAGTAIGSLSAPVILSGLAALAILGGAMWLLDALRARRA